MSKRIVLFTHFQQKNSIIERIESHWYKLQIGNDNFIIHISDVEILIRKLRVDTNYKYTLLEQLENMQICELCECYTLEHFSMTSNKIKFKSDANKRIYTYKKYFKITGVAVAKIVFGKIINNKYEIKFGNLCEDSEFCGIKLCMH